MEYSVNFTREPIIETVITPREGCHLAIRNSKGNGHEDYFVDAVEVVSFGHSFFFRSQERPNSFLVPVTDYEVLELKETRMSLKNASVDRSIKIGGGRDVSPPRPSRDAGDVENVEPKEGSSESSSEKSVAEQRKRDNKRRRGRRGGRAEPQVAVEGKSSSESEADGVLPESQNGEEPQKTPSFVSKLFPPPTTLIKETLSRYKFTEEVVPPIIEEKIEESFLEEKPPLPPFSEDELSSLDLPVVDLDEEPPSED